MYLADTGGQYLCVFQLCIPIPPHAPSAGRCQGAQSQHRDCITPITSLPLQGRDNRHHTDSALGDANPTPEGTRKDPSLVPSTNVPARAGCAGREGLGTVMLSPPLCPPQEAYTRVLMGNIDLSRLVFPPNTAGRR